jgi:hypothetical protein
MAEGIEKDLFEARYFYEAAEKVYDPRYEDDNNLNSGRFYWVPEIWAMQNMIPAEGWYTIENELAAIVGERYYWSLVGQTFLFGAAASLASKDQPDHYPSLLLIIPFLGICLALFSAIHINEANRRHERRRRTLYQMLEAKYNAYESILKKAKSAYSERATGPGSGYFDLIERATEDFEHDRKETSDLRRWTQMTESILLYVNFVFVVSWAVLLISESLSFHAECSHWWLSCCQQGTCEPA